MQNTQYIETLTGLGLGENEARVYFASLSLGPATVLKIADAAEIKRTTVYSVVESLKHKGLMRIELKGWKKLFTAEAPENLESILETRREKFKNLLPEFSALYNLKGGESTLKYYEGLAAVKSVYEGLIQDIRPHEDYIILSDLKKWLNLDEKYFRDFSQRRAKLNINIRMLAENWPAFDFSTYGKNYKINYKILPAETKLTTNLVVTPQKVVIHQLTPPVLAIVIENKSVIQMHKEMFEIMWRSLS